MMKMRSIRRNELHTFFWSIVYRCHQIVT